MGERFIFSNRTENSILIGKNVKFTKFNRTINVLNVDLEVLIDIGNNASAKLYVYKFHAGLREYQKTVFNIAETGWCEPVM